MLKADPFGQEQASSKAQGPILDDAQTFSGPTGKTLRVAFKEGRPYFVLHDFWDDLPEVMGSSDKIFRELEETGVDNNATKVVLFNEKQIPTQYTALSMEFVLAALQLSTNSKKKEFKNWVSFKVIPNITLRNKPKQEATQNSFAAPKTPEELITLLGKMQEAQATKLAQTESAMAQMRPIYNLGQTCLKSENNISVGEFAKLVAARWNLDIGRDRLIYWLRSQKLMMKTSAAPTQLAIEKGWLSTSQYPYATHRMRISHVTSWVTPKGEAALLEKLGCDDEWIEWVRSEKRRKYNRERYKRSRQAARR